MSGLLLTDSIVINYSRSDKDDCIHFLTHVDPRAKKMHEVVSPTAKCVYTSEFNAWYLKTYLGANSNVFGMEYERTYHFDVQGNKFLFAFVDSRYSTGSVMLILQGDIIGTILYTGYFSYYPGIFESPILQSIINKKALTKLFLDTTYYEQVTGFRSMVDITETIVKLIRGSKPKRIHINLRGMGLEHILVDIAESLNELIMVNLRTMMVMEQLKKKHLFTLSRSGVRIFVTSNLGTKGPQANPEEYELIVLERVTLHTSEHSPYVFRNQMHTFKFYCHPTHAECCKILSTFMAESTIPIGRNNFNNKIIYKTNITFPDKTLEFSSRDQNLYPNTEMGNESTRSHKSQEVSINRCYDKNKQILCGSDNLSTNNDDRAAISEVTGKICKEAIPETLFEPSSNHYQAPAKEINYISIHNKIDVFKNDKSPDSSKKSYSSEKSGQFKVDGSASQSTGQISTNSINYCPPEGKTSFINDNIDFSSSCSKLKSLFSKTDNGKTNIKVLNVDEINNSLIASGGTKNSITFKNTDNFQMNVLTKDSSDQLCAQSENVVAKSNPIITRKFVMNIEKNARPHNQFSKTGCSLLKNKIGVGDPVYNTSNNFSTMSTENGSNLFELINRPMPSHSCSRMNNETVKVNNDFYKLDQFGQAFSSKRKQYELVSILKKKIKVDETNRKLIEPSCARDNNVSHKGQGKEKMGVVNSSSYKVIAKDSVLKVPLVSDKLSSILVDPYQTSNDVKKMCSVVKSHEITTPNLFFDKSSNLEYESTYHHSNTESAVVTNRTISLSPTEVNKPLSIDSNNSKEFIGIEESQLDPSEVSSNSKNRLLKNQGKTPFSTSTYENSKKISIDKSQDNCFTPLDSDFVSFGPDKTIRKALLTNKFLVVEQSSVDKNLKKDFSVLSNKTPKRKTSQKHDLLAQVQPTNTNKTIVGNSLSPIGKNSDENMVPDACCTVLADFVDNNCNSCFSENVNQGEQLDKISYLVKNNEQFQTAARVRIFKRSLETTNTKCLEPLFASSKFTSNIEKISREKAKNPIEVHVMESNATNLDNGNVINESVKINQLVKLDNQKEHGNKIVDSGKTGNKSMDRIFRRKSKKNDITDHLTKTNNCIIVPAKYVDNKKSGIQSDEYSGDEDCEIDGCGTNINSQMINDITGISFMNASVIRVCYYKNGKKQTKIITRNNGDNSIADESMQNQGLERNDCGNSSQNENFVASSQELNILPRNVGNVKKQVTGCSMLTYAMKTKERRKFHHQSKLPSLLTESNVSGNKVTSVNTSKRKINAKTTSDCQSRPCQGFVIKNRNNSATVLTKKDKIHSTNNNCKTNPYVLLERNYLKSAGYTYSIKRHCFIPYNITPRLRRTYKSNFHKGIEKK